MIAHLFKLAWNRRRKNAILGIEILIAFLVLFAVSSIGLVFFKTYVKDRGFEFEKVYCIAFDWQNENKQNILQKKEQIVEWLKQDKEIENFSFTSNNTPYNQSIWMRGFNNNKIHFSTDIFYVDDNYFDVLGIKLIKGENFSKKHDSYKNPPVIINHVLEEKLEDQTPIIGKKIVDGDSKSNDGKEYPIIGVFERFKYQNDFSGTKNQTFYRISQLDTSVINPSTILIKVKNGINATFEQRLQTSLTKIVRTWNIDISILKDKRKIVNRQVLTPFIIFSIITGFLIFNVALGILGVLWYSINQRKSEIGLRRAMGASVNLIKGQFIGEMWMLTLLSLSIGIVIAIQFPILGVFNVMTSTYIQAIFLSVGFIYFLVTLCAMYPSSMAAKILPAQSLRDE